MKLTDAIKEVLTVNGIEPKPTIVFMLEGALVKWVIDRLEGRDERGV